MKNQDLHNAVVQKLADFESIGNISPSKEWNDSMMKRLSFENSQPTSNKSVTKYTIVILILILVNIGFIANSFLRSSQPSFIRNNDLNVISKELMVNPVSINF
jgi:hypothetical protein